MKMEECAHDKDCTWTTRVGCHKAKSSENERQCHFQKTTASCNAVHGCKWIQGHGCHFHGSNASSSLNQSQRHNSTKNNGNRHSNANARLSNAVEAELQRLRSECVNMENGISLDSFNSSSDLHFLKSVVPIGDKIGSEGKRHCFHAETLIKWVTESISQKKQPTHPLTRDTLSGNDIANIVKAYVMYKEHRIPSPHSPFLEQKVYYMSGTSRTSGFRYYYFILRYLAYKGEAKFDVSNLQSKILCAIPFAAFGPQTMTVDSFTELLNNKSKDVLHLYFKKNHEVQHDYGGLFPTNQVWEAPNANKVRIFNDMVRAIQQFNP